MNEVVVPKETIKIGAVTIVCDKPLAPAGFLSLTINGNCAGRIVFHRENYSSKGPVILHFNQTILYLEENDPLREQKKIVRSALCRKFRATDKTFDLRREE